MQVCKSNALSDKAEIKDSTNECVPRFPKVHQLPEPPFFPLKIMPTWGEGLLSHNEDLGQPLLKFYV